MSSNKKPYRSPLAEGEESAEAYNRAINSGKHTFDEVFEVEMDGWCYGITNYPGEIYPGLIHLIIKEIGPTFAAAIERGVVFDILALSKKFSEATKLLVHEKEIAYSMLAQLPSPANLDEDGQFTMAQIIDTVEQKYSGVLQRLERRWSGERQDAA